MFALKSFSESKMKSEYEVETGKANGYFALSSSGKKRGLTAVTRNGKIL